MPYFVNISYGADMSQLEDSVSLYMILLWEYNKALVTQG